MLNPVMSHFSFLSKNVLKVTKYLIFISYTGPIKIHASKWIHFHKFHNFNFYVSILKFILFSYSCASVYVCEHAPASVYHNHSSICSAWRYFALVEVDCFFRNIWCPTKFNPILKKILIKNILQNLAMNSIELSSSIVCKFSTNTNL